MKIQADTTNGIYEMGNAFDPDCIIYENKEWFKTDLKAEFPGIIGIETEDHEFIMELKEQYGIAFLF